jgi:NOL1/NOP2/fmu family ribosome biogenesis protein
MAQQLKILNSKEIKELHQKLLDQFGYSEKLDMVFLLSEKKEKIYIFNRDFGNIDLGTVRVDAMGLYFAGSYEGTIRLSMDGSQMIGPKCTKNVLEITKPQMQQWLMGEKLSVAEVPGASEMKSFVILRWGKHYLGCGKIAGELILNYIPKTRYIHALYEDRVPTTSTELDE